MHPWSDPMTWHRTDNEWTHPEPGSIRYCPGAGWYLECGRGERTGRFDNAKDARHGIEWFLSGRIGLPAQTFRHKGLGEVERTSDGYWISGLQVSVGIRVALHKENAGLHE
jgi:hypothetical protein